MARMWEENEEVSENEDLAVTEQRDAGEPLVDPERADEIETVHESPQEAMQELGEDVASSPAQRGEA